MTFNYAAITATADRLIARFGRSATLRRPASTGPAHNPTVTYSDHAVMVTTSAYQQREIDGTRVRQDDVKVMLAKGVLTIAPETKDQLVIDGATYAIMDVRPTQPGGSVVVYEVQARR